MFTNTDYMYMTHPQQYKPTMYGTVNFDDTIAHASYIRLIPGVDKQLQ